MTVGAPPGYAEPGFGQRLVARVIDTLLIAAVFLIADSILDGSLHTITALLFAAAYEVGFVANGGRTPGKMAMDIAVVDLPTGAPPSSRQAALRYLTVAAGGLATLVVPGLDPVAGVYVLVVLLPIMAPPLHRGLHDRASGTIVTANRR